MIHPADEIIGIFAARGKDVYFGENVSQLEHALQAAALAEKAAGSAPVVLAALLHDIGHMLHGLPETIADEGIDGRHQEAGANWLSMRFGPEVTEPVRLHVAAKRYLCCREPDYARGLSRSSLASLRLQGGPFDEALSREFEKTPSFREATAVRRWDDEAKVPGLEVPGIRHYRDLIAASLA